MGVAIRTGQSANDWRSPTSLRRGEAEKGGEETGKGGGGALHSRGTKTRHPERASQLPLRVGGRGARERGALRPRGGGARKGVRENERARSPVPSCPPTAPSGLAPRVLALLSCPQAAPSEDDDSGFECASEAWFRSEGSAPAATVDGSCLLTAFCSCFPLLLLLLLLLPRTYTELLV